MRPPQLFISPMTVEAENGRMVAGNSKPQTGQLDCEERRGQPEVFCLLSARCNLYGQARCGKILSRSTKSTGFWR